MNDQELLALAAKAAGIVEILFRNGGDDDGYDNGVWTYTWARKPDGKLYDWNPLADDGDALRLAVKLGFMNSGVGFARYLSEYQQIILPHVFDESMQYAATRRAIVRAAAAIGEQMK